MPIRIATGDPDEPYIEVPSHMRAPDPADFSNTPELSPALIRHLKILMAVGGQPLSDAVRDSYRRFSAKRAIGYFQPFLAPGLLRNIARTVATFGDACELAALEEMLAAHAAAALEA